MLSLVAGVALLAGCQSNTNRDLVQRELRRQEDQIFQLEDYLSDYQQLLCNARRENASLKQQLAKGQFRDGQAPRPAIESEEALPPPLNEPENPPSRLKAAPTEPADSPAADPSVPPLNPSDPSVPPLDTQSEAERELVDHDVEPAAAEMEAEIDSAPVGGDDHAAPPATEPEPQVAAALEVCGNVRPGTAEHGPRVLVQVEPVGTAGGPATVTGKLSILVLDPAARETEQQLARWDFAADDLQPLIRRQGTAATYGFPLQLPEDAPTTRPLELWVRLVPANGAKVLARTTLDVSRSGHFASAKMRPSPPAKSKPSGVIQASAAIPAQRARGPRRRAAGPTHQSGWTIARPGDVAPDEREQPETGVWKVATLPVPEAESLPVVERKPASPERDSEAPAVLPAWSPER